MNVKEKEKQFFDKCVENNINLSFYGSKFMLELLSALEADAFELMGNLAGKKILYYGCGVNYPPVRYLIKQNAKTVTMIDISPKSIEYNINRSRELALHNKVFPMVMDCENLDFPDNEFDIVFGKAILHHLNLNKSIKEIHRVLKPNGSAVFIEPLGMNPLINLYRKLTPQLRTPDEKPFENKELEMFRSSGFSDVQFSYYTLLSIAGVFLYGFTKKHLKLSLKYTFFAKMDSFLIKNAPFLSKLCWNIIILLKK